VVDSRESESDGVETGVAMWEWQGLANSSRISKMLWVRTKRPCRWGVQCWHQHITTLNYASYFIPVTDLTIALTRTCKKAPI